MTENCDRGVMLRVLVTMFVVQGLDSNCAFYVTLSPENMIVIISH